MIQKGDKVEYITAFIAFLDIMGFKDLVKKKSAKEIYDIFSIIVNQTNQFEELKNDISLTDPIIDTSENIKNAEEAFQKTRIYIMSDSIVVATPANNSQSLQILLDICYSFQYSLLEMETPILLRGAVSRGEIFLGEGINNVIAFGGGFIEAYSTEENYAKYPRIIVSKQVLKGNDITEEIIRFDEHDGYGYLNTLEQYLMHSVCVKNDEEKKLDIDNLKQLFRSTSEYKKVNKMIYDNLFEYNSESIRDKYMWINKEMIRVEKAYLQKNKAIELNDFMSIEL